MTEALYTTAAPEAERRKDPEKCYVRLSKEITHTTYRGTQIGKESLTREIFALKVPGGVVLLTKSVEKRKQEEHINESSAFIQGADIGLSEEGWGLF